MSPRRTSPWVLTPLVLLLAAWFPTHRGGGAQPGASKTGIVQASADDSASTGSDRSLPTKSKSGKIPFKHRAIGVLCSFLLSDCPQIKDDEDSADLSLHGKGSATVNIGGEPARADLSLHGKASAIVSVEGEASNPDFQEATAIQKTLEELSSYYLQVIIATVPDPKSSRMAPEFDRAIEAIQEAASSAGYSLDRYYLPWQAQSRGRSESSDKALRAAVSGVGEASEDPKMTPGMILFRWNGKNLHPHLVPRVYDQPLERLLLVFLVGETPTSGVHKNALLNALEQTKETKPDPQEPGAVVLASTLQILGPYFSASALSIQKTLDLWHAHGSSPNLVITDIVSGSASAVDPELLKPPTPQFKATVYPTEAMLGAFLNYVKFELQQDTSSKPDESVSDKSADDKSAEDKPIHEKSANEIAILEESNTVVGQAGTESYVLEKYKRPVTSLPRFGVSYLEIPFPLHISDLREAGASNGPTQDSSAQGRGSASPFPFERQSGAKEDVIPPFSSLDRAVVSDIMTNLLDTISRERIHYVAIHATDVQDIIYLAREISFHCPDTVIFTIGADLLVSDPSLQQNLRGVLAISTYPLFNTNQMWTPPFKGSRRRIQFANQEAEGVYNAMLALLPRLDLMLDYGVPFTGYAPAPPIIGPSPARPITDASPAPPIWLSVLGKGGPWPVALLDSSMWPPSVDPYLFFLNKDRRRIFPADANLDLGEIDFSRSTFSRAGNIAFGLMFLFALYFVFVQVTSCIQLPGDDGTNSSLQPGQPATTQPPNSGGGWPV